MILLQINDKAAPAWRCQARVHPAPVTLRRIHYPDSGTPDRLEETVLGKTSYYLEVFLTGRVLVCWTDAPVEACTVSGINTITQAMHFKTGEGIPCRITDREPPEKE